MKTWTDNPLVQPLVKEGKWPSLHVAIRMAVGLGLLVTAIITWLLTHVPYSSYPFIILSLVGWLVALFAPAIVGVVAGVSTTRMVDSEAFGLVRLTNISVREFIRGLVSRSLYQIRLLLALVVTIFPAAVLIVIHLVIKENYISCTTQCQDLMYRGMPCACTPWPMFGPIAIWLSLIVVVISVLGMNGLAAVLGVLLGLRIKRADAAIAIISIIILPLTIGIASSQLVFCGLGLAVAPISWLFYILLLVWDFLLFVAILYVSALPYVLTIWLMRLLRRWMK